MRSPAIKGPMPAKAAGAYPSKGAGLGEFGSTTYPTVIESYNRNSDYRRWKLGQEYFFGTGRSWADYEVSSFSRFLGGERVGVITAFFPSSTSPEASWHVACRPRGSITLPLALSAGMVTAAVDSPEPSNHTLIVNLGGAATPAQMNLYWACRGDAFEASASGPQPYDDLVPSPIGSVALTLIEVDTLTQRLYFDASSPAARVQRNGRTYWSQLPYDPSDPIPWPLDGSRHLCSSFKFFCTCPDFIGGAIADLDGPGSSPPGGRFPLPNASRDGALRDLPASPFGATTSAFVGPPSPFATGPKPLPEWESQGAGLYRQWRTLPRRRDRRRACKHIHAMRWQCGVPWLEPSDYPSSEERAFLSLMAESERRYSSSELAAYMQQRQLRRRYLMAVADATCVNLYPAGDPRAGDRPDTRPILWNDEEDPSGPGCRRNDWWLKRGTGELRIFNGVSNRFEERITVGSESFPVIETPLGDVPGAPQIVI